MYSLSSQPNLVVEDRYYILSSVSKLVFEGRYYVLGASQVVLVVKNLPPSEALISRLGRFPWSQKWQPPPVFLPGESHGQRDLVGYSP